MKTRLRIAAGAVALCLSCAFSNAFSASRDFETSTALLLAVCDTGGEWVAVAVPVLSPADALGAGTPFPQKGVGSVLPSNDCLELGYAPFVGAVVPDPGDVLAQDAAVWSRQGPVVRAPDTP